MKSTLFLICVALAAQTVSAQRKPQCTNPGIQWIINPIYVDGTTSNAIQGDGSPYVNGQPGVTAVVHTCDGQYDATLQLASPRTVSVSFARRLASNSFTPPWALSGSTQAGTGFFDVRNLFFVPSGFDRNQEYSFTTRLGSSGPESGNLTMSNPSPDAVSSASAVAGIANSPYPDSLVIVHHCPANANTTTCPNITNETWFAYPDPNPTSNGTSQTGLPITQVGTLLLSYHGGEVNAGEFSAPFLFTISLLN
jgi:hypothetical protein